MTNAEPDRFPELMKLIDHHWGFKQLRPLQEQAMRAVLAERESLVVLPTGAGKSLCFQAPALLKTTAVTVVVSPLIALMKDQVDGLRAADVPARHIDSSLTDAQRVLTFNELRAGQVRLLFVSPERLMMPNFQQFLQQLGVKTFAIDEAHCISHWGHDFRPEYRMLRTLREPFRNAVFHAYTATATERVRTDIVAQLGLHNPAILTGNFDRPNLVYRVMPRKGVLDQVVEILRKRQGEAGIIYCIRRKDVDQLTADLRALDFRAMPYHAGMTANDRKTSQDAFRAEKCDIIVATVAFGMGIDRSNVRFVLHTGMPKSIEHYQQEAGRAGRDGLEAECVMFHTGGDVITWKKILQKSAEENQVDAEFLPTAFGHLEEISAYCRGAVCRHRVLVEHFGQTFDSENCQACDMCLAEVDIEPQSQEIARKILSCVARVQERFGVNHVVSVLRGDATERIAKYGHEKLSTHGLLREFATEQVRDWTYQLIGLGVLGQSGDEYPLLKLNPASWEVMKNQRQVQLRKTASRSKGRTSRTEEESWEGVDRELAEKIRGWRREFAEAKGWPPYTIFSDDTLRELARVRPSNLENLRAVYGIGEAKLNAYGNAVLDIIIPHCRENSLRTDILGTAPRREAAAATPLSGVQFFAHFRKGASIEEVAKISGRAASTVIKYLCSFIESERLASVDAWVPPEIQRRVLEAAAKVGTAFLRPIFLELGEQVSYDHIRITLTHNVIGPNSA